MTSLFGRTPWSRRSGVSVRDRTALGNMLVLALTRGASPSKAVTIQHLSGIGGGRILALVRCRGRLDGGVDPVRHAGVGVSQPQSQRGGHRAVTAALVKQDQDTFSLDGLDLQLTEDASRRGRAGLLRGTGARGVRAILAEVLLDTMYDLPERLDGPNVGGRRWRLSPAGQPHAGAAPVELASDRCRRAAS